MSLDGPAPVGPWFHRSFQRARVAFHDDQLLHTTQGGWCAQLALFTIVARTGGWYWSYFVPKFGGMAQRIKTLHVLLHFLIWSAPVGMISSLLCLSVSISGAKSIYTQSKNNRINMTILKVSTTAFFTSLTSWVGFLRHFPTFSPQFTINFLRRLLFSSPFCPFLSTQPQS